MDNPVLLKSRIERLASSKTSRGRMDGPAPKLCNTDFAVSVIIKHRSINEVANISFLLLDSCCWILDSGYWFPVQHPRPESRIQQPVSLMFPSFNGAILPGAVQAFKLFQVFGSECFVAEIFQVRLTGIYPGSVPE